MLESRTVDVQLFFLEKRRDDFVYDGSSPMDFSCAVLAVRVMGARPLLLGMLRGDDWEPSQRNNGDLQLSAQH